MSDKDIQILVVSTQPKAMSDRLQELGFSNIAVVADAENAFKFLEHKPASLLIADYNATQTSNLLELLKRNHGTKGIPIIIFNNVVNPETDFTEFGKENHVFVCDVWDPASVGQAIKETLGRELQMADPPTTESNETHEMPEKKWRELIKKFGEKIGDGLGQKNIKRFD